MSFELYHNFAAKQLIFEVRNKAKDCHLKSKTIQSL